MTLVYTWPHNPRMPTLPPTYLSVGQAARALGVSVTTIRRWTDQGILGAARTPGNQRRYLRTDVEKLLETEAAS